MARGFWFRFSAFLKERHWIIQNIMIPLGFSPLYLNDIEKRQTPKPKTVINKDCESNTELHLYMHFQHDMWIQYKQKLKLSRTVSIVCCWLNKRILRLSFWVCLVFFSGFFSWSEEKKYHSCFLGFIFAFSAQWPKTFPVVHVYAIQVPFKHVEFDDPHMTIIK